MRARSSNPGQSAELSRPSQSSRTVPQSCRMQRQLRGRQSMLSLRHSPGLSLGASAGNFKVRSRNKGSSTMVVPVRRRLRTKTPPAAAQRIPGMGMVRRRMRSKSQPVVPQTGVTAKNPSHFFRCCFFVWFLQCHPSCLFLQRSICTRTFGGF